MTPFELARFRERFLRPGLVALHECGGPPPSDSAERLLLAIALQESACANRYQVLGNGLAGPARGWWQFERLGGVVGVMTHPASRDLARRLCDLLSVRWQSAAVWRSLEGNDMLAAGFARLLLWTDPLALPGGSQTGWDYYQRNWRPGKPHPSTWHDHWQTATAEVFREPAAVPA